MRDASDPWQHLLHARITGRFLDLSDSAKTSHAEEVLGMSPNVYFYVNAPHPHFGQQVAVFRLEDVSDPRYVRVSPFDSGGLATGKIPLRKSLAPHELIELFQTHSYELRDYWVEFLTWARAAYRRLANYVESREPSFHVVEEVDLPGCTSSQAWLWEARMHKMRNLPVTLRPTRVFIGLGDRRRYLEWAATSGRFGSDQARRHTKHFLRVAVESTDPAHDAVRYLTRTGVKR